jgi:hypothetical protein
VSLEQVKAPKKPYEKPVLRVYGDLGAVTRTTGTTGSMDQVAKSMIDKTA